jgi:hypothetical protein
MNAFHSVFELFHMPLHVLKNLFQLFLFSIIQRMTVMGSLM